MQFSSIKKAFYFCRCYVSLEKGADFEPQNSNHFVTFFTHRSTAMKRQYTDCKYHQNNHQANEQNNISTAIIALLSLLLLIRI